jgi:hypothetical protein
MRQDAELSEPADRVWLESHIAGCPGCQVSSEEMAEAGISYRVWAPVAPGLYLFRDTLAKAADSIGADWSGVERPATGGSSAGPGSATGGSGAARSGRLTIVGAAATLVVAVGLGFFAGQVADSTIDPAEFPATAPASSPGVGQPDRGGDRDDAVAGPADDQPAQAAATGTDAPPPTSPSAAPQDSPPETGSSAPSPPATDAPGDGGSSGGGSPSDGGSTGGEDPVTPPTPPTPADPPRDPKQPVDPPPPTGPPVLVPVDPKLPSLNPSRPTRIP